jgi:hypothetical protein
MNCGSTVYIPGDPFLERIYVGVDTRAEGEVLVAVLKECESTSELVGDGSIKMQSGSRFVVTAFACREHHMLLHTIHATLLALTMYHEILTDIILIAPEGHRHRH